MLFSAHRHKRNLLTIESALTGHQIQERLFEKNLLAIPDIDISRHRSFNLSAE